MQVKLESSQKSLKSILNQFSHTKKQNIGKDKKLPMFNLKIAFSIINSNLKKNFKAEDIEKIGKLENSIQERIEASENIINKFKKLKLRVRRRKNINEFILPISSQKIESN
jgi:hypothetical protein